MQTRLLPRQGLFYLGLASLAGCAALAQQPAPAPSQLSVVIENSNAERPAISIYNDDYDCFGVISVELDEQNRAATAQIPHKPFTTFQAKWTSHKRAEVGLDKVECEVTATLDSANLSEITLTTSGDSSECAVSVSGKNASGEVRKLPYQKRVLDILQFYSEGPFCQPDPRFQGSSTYSKPRS